MANIKSRFCRESLCFHQQPCVCVFVPNISANHRSSCDSSWSRDKCLDIGDPLRENRSSNDLAQKEGLKCWSTGSVRHGSLVGTPGPNWRQIPFFRSDRNQRSVGSPFELSSVVSALVGLRLTAPYRGWTRVGQRPNTVPSCDRKKCRVLSLRLVSIVRAIKARRSCSYNRLLKIKLMATHLGFNEEETWPLTAVPLYSKSSIKLLCFVGGLWKGRLRAGNCDCQHWLAGLCYPDLTGDRVQWWVNVWCIG